MPEYHEHDQTTGAPSYDTTPQPSGGSGAVGFLAPVRVASGASTDMTESPPSGPATIDSITLDTGDRVLLTVQDEGIDNGIWVVDTSGDWTRPADFAAGTTAVNGSIVATCYDGTKFYSSLWMLDYAAAIGTDTIQFQAIMMILPFYPSVSQGEPYGSLGVGGAVIYGDHLPTADPHVVGVVWNNGGVVTISAGP